MEYHDILREATRGGSAVPRTSLGSTADVPVADVAPTTVGTLETGETDRSTTHAATDRGMARSLTASLAKPIRGVFARGSEAALRDRQR